MDNKSIANSMRKFSRHLGSLDDITLIILRGHLLIESEIDQVLENQLKWSKPVKDSRFRFSDKVKITKALLGKDESVRLKLHLVDKLNKLRNNLAHNLSPTDNGELDCLITEGLDGNGWEKYDNNHKLKLVIAEICANLCMVYAVKENNHTRSKTITHCVRSDAQTTRARFKGVNFTIKS